MAQFVSQDDFDDHKTTVMRELGSLSKAVTDDARMRARQNLQISQQLEALSQRIDGRKGGQDKEDITGRFQLAEMSIIKKATKKSMLKEIPVNVIGTSLAMFVYELMRLYLHSKGQ